MLAELKDKSQVTIPKTIVRELGLERGDMFDVVIVYPKAKADELEALAAAARESAAMGQADVYEDVEDLIANLHAGV